MRKNSKNIYKEINDFFAAEPSTNQKAWDIIHDFYHLLLTYMDDNGISKSDLAKRLGKSRSSITQLFNKNPNVTVKTLVEIANALGIEISLRSPQLELAKDAQIVVVEWKDTVWDHFSPTADFELVVPCTKQSGRKVIDSPINRYSQTVH